MGSKRRSRSFYEAPEMEAFMRRMARALARRAAEGDLEALAAIVAARADLADALEVGARGAHEHGYSWTEIGREIGITRQAARQRFAAGPEQEEQA